MLRYLRKKKGVILIAVCFCLFLTATLREYGKTNSLAIQTVRYEENHQILMGHNSDHVEPKEKVKFDPHQPKMVLLLSYQRCGSSFTAQLFNQNQNVLYVFEPLDALYHAMYGVQQGYSVPSDIFFYGNGTKRTIPEFEKINAAKSLDFLLKCDFDHVPAEILMHKFMEVGETFFSSNTKSLHPFINCLIDRFRCNCNPSRQTCGKTLKHTCPTRFGEDHARHMKCHEALWKGTADLNYFSNNEVDMFFEYKHCMKRMNLTMCNHCMPILKDICSNRTIRAVKTVRLTMESAELMLKDNPNLRIIHLIRDPRGVVLSRHRVDSFRGLYSGTDMPKEAELYCRQAVEDIKQRKVIEEKYPGATLQIIYEDLTQNPKNFMDKVYSFLDESIPNDVQTWWYNNTKGVVKDSKAIAEKWQNKLTYAISKNISDVCSEFYNIVNYNWP